jgi:phage terminase small subunit
MSTLTPKREAFCVAMADPECKGPSDAYTRAYDAERMTPKQIANEANKLLQNREITGRIAELRQAVAAPVLASAAFVLQEWLDLHLADANELTTARRFCCRHCYGIEHRYQWVNEDEYAVECAKVIDYNAAKSARQHSKPLPLCDGGFGYQRDKLPVDTCPHCNGDGYLDVYIADMRNVSPRARKLFAGVKTTQNGVEVKMRDQDAALANIARYLGMFVERHMHGGDPNNPTPIKAATLTGEMTQAEAAKLYQAAVIG